MGRPKCSQLETSGTLRIIVETGSIEIPPLWIEKGSVVYLQRYRDLGFPFFSISKEKEALYTYDCWYEGKMLRYRLKGHTLDSRILESLRPCAMLFREPRVIEAWNYLELIEYNKKLEALPGF